jgi:hypothetical protein
VMDTANSALSSSETQGKKKGSRCKPGTLGASSPIAPDLWVRDSYLRFGHGFFQDHGQLPVGHRR